MDVVKRSEYCGRKTSVALKLSDIPGGTIFRAGIGALGSNPSHIWVKRTDKNSAVCIGEQAMSMPVGHSCYNCGDAFLYNYEELNATLVIED